MKLIIVESPTKSRTLKGFLGKGYEVLSSFGHIRDLPKGKLGVDVEHDFNPEYVIPTKARKTVTALKKAAKKADEVILATDEDREGEAIAFHLKEILSLKNPQRIVFHEITKGAIQEALKNPRFIDENLVLSQQARRILDRLVGYNLSPFLWKKVAKRLSAGRVQSVAVRLVAKREKEIKAFIPQEYWDLTATLLTKSKEEFQAQLSKKNGESIEKLAIKNKEESDAVLKELEGASYSVESIERKETKRNPLPPFTTSTLQQASWQRFHYSARFTMQLAQHLYETGLITYHRTDSVNLSMEALRGAKEFIEAAYGKQYWAGERRYKTKSKGAQEAHEAIRPASPKKTSESLKGLKPQELRLYDLVWRRFMASQMVPALIDATSIDVKAGTYTFRANGQILRFDGFLKVYSLKFDEATLPVLKEGDNLSLKQLTPDQHFTLPPPRYNEASLVKALESYGVGRPSTYAPILSLIQARNYVSKDEQKRFVLTELGEAVDNILTEHFPNIVDVEFTAEMENDLDEVAEGKKEWVPMLREFYFPFEKNLKKKYEEVEKKPVVLEATDKLCPQCGSPVIMRFGRFGKFYACSTFPKCKYTESLEKQDLGFPCPLCKEGKVTTKRTKTKRIFYGCNKYPACTFALWQKPTGELCKACQAPIVEGPKKRIMCSNAQCSTRVL